jgi:hypothetical protein
MSQCSSSQRHGLVAAIAKGFPDLEQFVRPKPKAGWTQHLLSRPQLTGLACPQDPKNESASDTDSEAKTDSVPDGEPQDANIRFNTMLPLREYFRQLLPDDQWHTDLAEESDKVLILVKACVNCSVAGCTFSMSSSAAVLENVLNRVRYRGQLISHKVDDHGVLWCKMATVAQAKRLASRLEGQKVMEGQIRLECLQASPVGLPPGVAPSGTATRGKFEAAPKVSAHHNSGPYAQPQDHGGKAKTSRGGVRNRPMPGGKGPVPGGAAGRSAAGYSEAQGGSVTPAESGCFRYMARECPDMP